MRPSNQRRWWSRHRKQEVTIDSPSTDEWSSRTGSDDEPLSLASTLADRGSSPFDHAAQHQLRERVEAALREVPETFRTVVVLREIEGFTYEEIAEILQTNLGTVKSRLTRGRAALRTLLAPIPCPVPPSGTAGMSRSHPSPTPPARLPPGGLPMNTPQTCQQIQAAFSAYLDGAVPGHTMQEIARHLEGTPAPNGLDPDGLNPDGLAPTPACDLCAREFAAWRSTQDALACLGPAKPPADLGLKLRLAISRERARRNSRLLDQLSLRWDNAIRPLVMQAAAGVAATTLLVGSIMVLLGAVAPANNPVLADDESLSAIHPAPLPLLRRRPRRHRLQARRPHHRRSLRQRRRPRLRLHHRLRPGRRHRPHPDRHPAPRPGLPARHRLRRPRPRSRRRHLRRHLRPRLATRAASPHPIPKARAPTPARPLSNAVLLERSYRISVLEGHPTLSVGHPTQHPSIHPHPQPPERHPRPPSLGRPPNETCQAPQISNSNKPKGI